MKYISIVIYIAFSIGILSACSAKQKKPIGNFQSVECRTICNNNQCTQQCISASGDYYKK
ncbi:hypothetical protein LS66_007385 [Helicobacter sp. MIT 03-1614]|jgi:hypothetical protein|uniref:Lipoprotein n=1 Tax=Helicobacter hepaticus (strain ATCC 51449 / 3B1) TaxID=235279 RepID=Q7VJS3_HELHP|nr:MULTISPECIES: hypothetical protein [Helicobacter]AAP76767.1 hypothetical protein HH_0170 [Helicobacter hepaticus ATCC 51449]TLD87713.1 hypothetical protein LS66_007385 [Helicobacter sp. MIT 03-1614]